MRQLRYSVASSLDGFIAGPNGEYDWIVIDPDIDFTAMYNGCGGLAMGRRSYDVFVATGGAAGEAPIPTYVYSRSLPEGPRGGVTIVRDAASHVASLKQVEGKPLWLWGGSNLFGEMAAAGLVDGVDVAIIPVILGRGIPLMDPSGPRLSLRLRMQRVYSKTGTLYLEYDVVAPG
jgi:dihydrofolate reductase